MKQYVSYSFYVYFNKGEKMGMERVLEKGASEKCTFPFNHVYCLNKNLILVWLLFLGLFGEKAVF